MEVEIAGLLRREVTTLVFDQYGTIVDMQGGLAAAVTPFLAGKGWTGDPHRFVTWWRRTHFEDSMIDSLCDRGHTPYRQIGHRAVANVMRRAGIEHTHEEVRWLVALIERLKPFPDVLDALEQLHRRYWLAILSNGDPDMLAAAGPHIGFEFDAVISVEEAGYFNPTTRRTRRPANAWASIGQACSSSPTTPSTASVRRRTGCAPHSSTGASGRSAIRRTSRI